MSDNDSVPSGNPPPSHRDDRSESRHLERVVEELRMVLSDLGHSQKPPDDVNSVFRETKDIPDLPNGHTAEPESIPLESTKPGKSAEPVSSDADFWNGNVLGWPHAPDPDLEDLPLPSATGSFNDPLGALAEPDGGNNFAQELGLKDDLSVREAVEALHLEEPDNEPPLPDEQTVPHTSSYGAVENETLNNWDLPDFSGADPVLPEAPMSPMGKSDPVPQNSPTDDPPMADNPFAPSIDVFIKESKSSASDPKKTSPPPSDPLTIPIPQTIHKKTDPPPPPPDPNLSLETTDLKPKGLVQIACIFPEGQEKAGQNFVSKLREIGEKSKKELNIQAVFVHPWSSDKVNVAAWKKSAVLSGADIMFVLVSKTEANSLKTLSADPMGEIRSRIVYLEQVPMRPLYADIVVELQRGK